MSNGDGFGTPTYVEFTAGLVPLNGSTKKIPKDPVMLLVQQYEALLPSLVDNSRNSEGTFTAYKARVTEASASRHR